MSGRDAGGGGDGGERGGERRRLRGFLAHLAAYAVVMGALVIVNLAATPENPWFAWPMVGWGGILAIHVAYVMGGFGNERRETKRGK